MDWKTVNMGNNKDKLRVYLKTNLDNAKTAKDKAYWQKQIDDFNKNFINDRK